MIEEIRNLLAAAESNLVRYKEMGDEDAIRAGEGMVSDFRKLLEKFEGKQ